MIPAPAEAAGSIRSVAGKSKSLNRLARLLPLAQRS